MGLGFCLVFAGQPFPSPWVCLLAMPDWLLTVTGIWRGNNVVRVASGVLLGMLYVCNWYWVFHLQFVPELWLVNSVMVSLYLAVMLRVRYLARLHQGRRV